MSVLSRRLFLERTLGSAALAAASGAGSSLLAAPSHAREAAHITSTSLGPNLSLITGAGCNIVALGAPEGALLVDGGLAQHSSALLKEVKRTLNTSRVKVLFNTHWHPEQTGLNERAGKMGATLIAHENTKLWLSRPIRTSWLPKPYGPLPEKARPSKTTYTTDSISYGGEEIEYGYMIQAHTDGDIYVHFKNANVLVAGGVVSGDGWPRLDYETGGWMGGLVAGYDRLLKVADANTRVVPADGPILSRGDLEAHRKMYFTLYERLVALLNKGLGPDEVIAAAPAKGLADQWGNPDAFVESAFRSLWGHFAPDA
ncbi:MAG: MBL fold metallo-hydrolase [Steroidobacteraceae bacterium]|nr:MBL fold metallo-hydrolase [Steroidobacteraceae bacterium]